MALHTEIRNLAEQFRFGVPRCCQTAHRDEKRKWRHNGLRGHAAAIFCHRRHRSSLEYLGNGHTRLEMLAAPEFGLRLKAQEIYELGKWFRNALVHMRRSPWRDAHARGRGLTF